MAENTNCLSFLNSSEYQVYNRELAKALGSIHAAIFLSELINRRDYHKAQKTTLTHDGKEWFYYTHDKGIERLAMSRKEQDSAIRVLIKHGIIEKIQKGVPAKRYFWIDEEKILNMFGLSKKHSRMTETDKLDCPKGTNWNDRNGQTGPYIYKNPSKNPTEDNNSSDSKISSKQPPTGVRFSRQDKSFIGIDEKDFVIWKEAYPYVDAKREFPHMVDWLLANPSKANKKNWRKFVTGWLSRKNDSEENKKA